jgi:hypothetical protein
MSRLPSSAQSNQMTLRTAPNNDRLSQSPDQLLGSRHSGSYKTVADVSTPLRFLRPWRHRLQGVAMPEKRRKYDREFRAGAVRIVNETKKPIAVVARDLGVNEGTLGNWVVRDREARQGSEGP